MCSCVQQQQESTSCCIQLLAFLLTSLLVDKVHGMGNGGEGRGRQAHHGCHALQQLVSRCGIPEGCL